MIALQELVQQSPGFTLHVDLGQVIIASLIGVVGFFVKRTIREFGDRIDKHEVILFRMAQDLQFVIGRLGFERRTIDRSAPKK